uniref:Uncharacterized protein n=1 Tax=Parascaris univalens TaxID=6257 RepID=A0A915CDD9_PARUN
MWCSFQIPLNTMIAAVATVILSTVICSSQAQMMRQCECSEAEECLERYCSFLIPCIDKCQSRVTALGADLHAIKQCFIEAEPSIKAATTCVQKRLPDACTREPPKMVPRHYAEGLKIALMTEVNAMAQRSGVTEALGGIFSGTKRLVACMQTCMDKMSDHCMSSAHCQLLLPPDTVFVQMMKECAIEHGFDTASFRQMCQCFASAGITQLKNVCSRIVIS